MKKALLAVCLVAGVAMASPKSFRVTLSEPATVGTTELKAGEYQAEINGDKLTMKRGDEVAAADVKVETVANKFDSTSVLFDTGNGKKTIEQIRLGGTKMKLLLNSVSAGDAVGSH